MNTKIIVAGKIYAVAKKSFEDQETIYAQFLNKTDNGGVEIQQVKITENSDLVHVKEGVTVQIPVKISSFNNKLYFTQLESMLKADMK